MSLIATYIPAGQKQYFSYTTTVAKPTIPGNTNPSQTQAANDSGGTLTTNAVGDYTYTFKTKAPTNFDPTVTHAIGISARSRPERVHHSGGMGSRSATTSSTSCPMVRP